MVFFLILSINEDVVQVYNNKNIELFYQDLVYIFLEYDWYIG